MSFHFWGHVLNGREITVLGAGIGGLASAIALAQRGAKVTVYEQAAEICEVGAGLQITPNGVAVLDALGLATDIRQAGIAARAVELRDYRRGALVVRLDMSSRPARRPYLLLHRADLIGLLAGAARACGVTIQLGCKATRVSEGVGATRVEFSDNRAVDAPLLIGGDGLHSRLRHELDGSGAPFFTRQVAWRAMIEMADADRRHVEVHMGPGRHVVTYPVRGGRLLNIVAVEEREEWAEEGWSQPGDAERLRASFSMFGSALGDSLARVETVNMWGLFRHPVAKRWFGKHSALVGDSAHPTLPFLAQGANLALEDAWVLAECLSRSGQDAALAEYQRRRRARVVRVIEAANANARNYHLRNPLVRLAAHSVLRAAGRVAPERLIGRFDWIHDFDVTREGVTQHA